MSTNLMQGDCLERMKEISDGSVDMVLTDPPYGTTACKWDSVIPFEPMWEQLKRVTKKNGAIVMTASQPFTSALVMSNPKMFKYCWIWEKNKATGHLNAKKRPLAAHEEVVVFYDNPPTYNPIKTNGHKRKVASQSSRDKSIKRGKSKDKVYQDGIVGKCGDYDSTERYPRSVQLFKSDVQKSKLHPTQKPVALMEYLIKTYTNEGETVLDFTMGSGTTGVACVNLNRDFIGIELDKEYCDIANDRITAERQKLL